MAQSDNIASIETLQTPLVEKHSEFLGCLIGLSACNREPPTEKDGKYLTELQRFLAAKLEFSAQLFADDFAIVFDLDSNQTNYILNKYEIAEAIGAMAYKIYLLECD